MKLQIQLSVSDSEKASLDALTIWLKRLNGAKIRTTADNHGGTNLTVHYEGPAPAAQEPPRYTEEPSP